MAETKSQDRVQAPGARPRRSLRVLVVEPEGQHGLRRLIRRTRRIRYAADEQECTELAYAAAGDVMLLDLDRPAFADPTFVARLRFVSRGAFPILGVASQTPAELAALQRAGLAAALPRAALNPLMLDRVLRHWVRHYRMRERLARSDGMALAWWKSLVDALDELRRRIARQADSLAAFLTLLDGQEGEIRERRAQHLESARRELAELRRIAADLEGAAGLIRRKGIARSKRDNLAGRRALLPEAWLPAGGDRARENWVDPPRARSPQRGTRRR